MTMTVSESAILDLYDAGISMKAIVKHGFDPCLVRFVIGSYGGIVGDKAELGRHRKMMSHGSQSLAAAILQARAA